KALVAEMGRVENHAEPLHLAYELAATLAEVALGVGPLGVDAGTVVAGPNRPQAIGVGALEMAERHEGVSSFKAQDVPDRTVVITVPDPAEVALERGRAGDRHELARLLHRSVPRKLRL